MTLNEMVYLVTKGWSIAFQNGPILISIALSIKYLNLYDLRRYKANFDAKHSKSENFAFYWIVSFDTFMLSSTFLLLFYF